MNVLQKILFFFAAGNQILKYHGDKSVLSWKAQECGVAICFLEIRFRIYPFYHSFSYVGCSSSQMFLECSICRALYFKLSLKYQPKGIVLSINNPWRWLVCVCTLQKGVPWSGGSKLTFSLRN